MKPVSDDHRPGLPPPRFSLATLLWIVGGLGILFAAMGYLGSHGTLLLLLFALAILAHVAGNALGTQLRANGDRPIDDEGLPLTRQRNWQPAADSDFAPATRLRQRSSLGKPAFIATTAGVVLGGTLGGIGLTYLMDPFYLPMLVLGVFAAAVLGGIWFFLAASFCQVALGAAWQAAKSPEKPAAGQKVNPE